MFNYDYELIYSILFFFNWKKSVLSKMLYHPAYTFNYRYPYAVFRNLIRLINDYHKFKTSIKSKHIIIRLSSHEA